MKIAPVSNSTQYPKSTSGKKAGKTVATAMYLAALPGNILHVKHITKVMIDSLTKPEMAKVREMCPDVLTKVLPKAALASVILGSFIGLALFRAIGGAIGKHFDKKQDEKFQAQLA